MNFIPPQTNETWPEPFSSGGPGKVITWAGKGAQGSASSGICFEATLVEPTGSDRQPLPSILPLVIYFAGLGSDDPFQALKPSELAQHASVPFVLAVPLRPKGQWWTISNDGHWGWCDGDFLPDQAELFSEWIKCLARKAGIDKSRVSVFGFSAGAHAATEIIASERGNPGIFMFVLGGVNSHGEPDLKRVQGKRIKNVEQIKNEARLTSVDAPVTV